MSRSYKKVPLVKDHGGRAKATIKESNRKMRHLNVYNEISNGSAWKKNVCGWDVCDWICMETYEGYIADTEKLQKEVLNGVKWYYNQNDVDKRTYARWYKFYKRK